MSLDFSCPKPDHEGFKSYWDEFLPSVKERENLKQPHLRQLRILCDLYVELDELQTIIDLEGRTYVSEGRNGIQIKIRPEVSEKNRVVSEIRNYSKMLGLILVKDTQFNDKEEKNDFA